MNPIEVLLKNKKIIVIDGALATELERRGCDLNDALWSAKVLLEQPELIRQVHLDYFNAGADCAITASYQATVQGFAKRGLSEVESIALMKKSVQLADEARTMFMAANPERSRPFIAASVGPYGAFLADGSEYRGDYSLSRDELVEFHRPRVKALLEAGADVLACETIPCLLEAKALLRLLQEYPAAQAWFTFSAKDESHSCHGELISDCAKLLNDSEQVVAIGVNCTAPKYITRLIEAIKSATDKPIVVYPNSGEVYNPETNTWHGETHADDFGEQARAWYAAGAHLIGGCCRTTPEHISAIASSLVIDS